MAYASGADMVSRYDVRTLGDLLGDTGSRIAAASVPANANLLAIMEDASGMIDAALMVSGRYSASDLTGLTGASQAHLKRITCQIAMAYTYDRRPMYDMDAYAKQMELAEKTLERLRKGENVFNLAPQIDAGNPTIDGPSSLDYSRLNMLPDRTQRFFPSRPNRLPTDRS